MKKVLMFFTAMFFMTGLAMADSPEVEGRIKNFDIKKSIFSIVDVNEEEFAFAIVPSTEVEFENRLKENGKVNDLKIGQWVKVEYIQGTKTNTAQEITIYKEKVKK